MILVGTQRITKPKTVAQRISLMLTILPCNIGIVHFNNFINFPVTGHDDKKWRVLKNDQNWKIELFKTDVEAESKYGEN